MGNSRNKTESEGTSKASATEEEKRLNQLELQRMEELNPQMTDVQSQGLDLVTQLLSGSSDLPGEYGDLINGIDESVTDEMSQKAVQDLMPGFQGSGILDSGVAAELASRRASDIRLQSAQYNQGNKVGLLNLALAGQGQVQQPIQAGSNALSQRLAGLRDQQQWGVDRTSNKGKWSGLWGAYSQG